MAHTPLDDPQLRSGLFGGDYFPLRKNQLLQYRRCTGDLCRPQIGTNPSCVSLVGHHQSMVLWEGTKTESDWMVPAQMRAWGLIDMYCVWNRGPWPADQCPVPLTACRPGSMLDGSGLSCIPPAPRGGTSPHCHPDPTPAGRRRPV